MIATGTPEALAVLQAEIAKIEPVCARIEEARSELAALEKNGQPDGVWLWGLGRPAWTWPDGTEVAQLCHA
jgi:hypothetical protein